MFACFLSPPGLVVGRCGAAAGAPSPPSYDRSETASSTGPPEDYKKVCHRSGGKRFPSHLHSCLVLSLRSRRSPFIVKVSLSDRLLEVRHTGLIKRGQTAEEAVGLEAGAGCGEDVQEGIDGGG